MSERTRVGGGRGATRRVRVLPDAVANQIAAGEVVERPASVVKELVENAIDAGAGEVRIELARGGKRRIRVVDDGAGMVREDALLAFDRHATSKIESAGDLRSVRTFGFRGEALPSIAAVSRLTLETRHAEDEVGTRIRLRGGTITAVEDLARRVGTTVDVENLFHNAPARAKFLKAVSAETRAASDAVVSLALANPGVSFRLLSDGRSLLELDATADLSIRVGQIWGFERSATLLPLRSEQASIRLVGLVQRPDLVRSGARRAHLFVNGRPFRDRALLRAADEGYRTTVPERTRPWLFLYLQVPDGDVDVNVHPAKHEVRFRDGAAVLSAVERAVASALATESSAAPLSRAPVSARAESAADQSGSALPTGTGTTSGAPSMIRERPGGGESAPAGEPQMALFVAGEGRTALEDAATVGEYVQPTPAAGARLFQALDTYILAETRDGVLIIDQHSAHERVLFHELMQAYEAGGRVGQRLLFPLTVKLTKAECAVVAELAGVLDRTGFEVEEFGGDTVIVHSVPDPHPWFDAERCFREMIAELTEGSELVRAARNQHERIAKTFACKGAIKAGQRLTEREMQVLVDQLFATDLPHHDVHGRPTVIRLSAAELARRFER